MATNKTISGEPNRDWSDAENELVVADYFAMLANDIVGARYNKAEHNRFLREQLPHRSQGSVEFKHQNISAVLLALGQPWIIGYKPAARFQNALVDAVLRWIDSRPDWLKVGLTNIEHGGSLQGPATAVRETEPLWIGPPPTHSNEPAAVDVEFMAAMGRKYDVAARDAANRALGRAGEERVLAHERANLRQVGRSDLAERVRWTSVEDGDGWGYDISSFDPDATPRLIEVKTTNGWERTPFHLSRNECEVADVNRDTWHLIRLWNYAREPRAFSIRPPLQNHVALTPTSFLANLH